MRRILFLIGLCLVIGVIVGCQSGSKQQTTQGSPPTSTGQAPAPSPGEATPPTEVPAQGTATITGRVVYNGAPPAARPVSFGGEVQCAAMHKDKPLYYEEVVVNPNGTLQWVFVYVKEGVQGEFKPPSTPLVMDQVGCQFIPHVAGVMPFQLIEFRNSDPLMHNVRAQPKVAGNKGFNFAQPKQGEKTIQTFAKPEIGIPIRCDVHAWMASYIHVVPHPFFAVSDEQGNFTIKNLPPGTYTLEAWHEKLGTQTATVTVQAGESKTVEFTFQGK